jgi:DNA-binding MarR family transcriptional regulator
MPKPAASFPSPIDVALAMRDFDASLDLLDHAVAGAFGIGRTDLRAIEVISRFGAKTAGDLAVHLGLTTGAVTALTDRMEKAGFLRRVRSTTDRRQVLVELTPSAKRREASIFGPLARESAKSLGRYSGPERAVIIDFLQRAKQLSDHARARIDRRL